MTSSSCGDPWGLLRVVVEQERQRAARAARRRGRRRGALAGEAGAPPQHGSSAPLRLLHSVRPLGDVLGRDRLGSRTTVTPTRESPADWRGLTGRIDPHVLRAQAFAPTTAPRIFVRGPTSFVKAVATALVDLGHPPSAIRLERFGDSTAG